MSALPMISAFVDAVSFWQMRTREFGSIYGPRRVERRDGPRRGR